MQITDLDYLYPVDLVAQVPSRPTRVAYIEGDKAPVELGVPALLEKIQPGDVLVINESKVIPARIFSAGDDEILFLKQVSERSWEVLFPSRSYSVGDKLALPGDVEAVLVQKGLPQILEVSQPLSFDYFYQHGEVALPPYIQESRGERHNRPEDVQWYQPQWARDPGSVASPTASLHFSAADLESLQARGVYIAPVTLHVGAGTFLPVRGERFQEHKMHSERFEISELSLLRIEQAKRESARVWALGTTAARALEGWARGDRGQTDIFIYPPYAFKMVDALITNFHQPRSTLLALVAAFAGLEQVKRVYQWAVIKKFKLFSYGDVSVWLK